MVPKIIHHIWIGDKDVPIKWIKTWKEKNPQFEQKIWRERDIDSVVKKNRKIYDYFYKKEKWYGASDVARIEILEKFGGIYIDADTECLEPIDDLLNCDFFAVEANPLPEVEYRVSNSVIGAIPHHPIIQEYIKRMGEAKKIEPLWNTIGGALFTEVIQEKKGARDIILPPHTFYPENSKGTIRYKGKEKIYARHYWGTTKKLY